MPQEVVIMPNRLCFDESLAFGLRLHNTPKADEYLFNFQNTGFVEPFGMLYTLGHIRRFMRERSPARFMVNGHQNLTYAGHMGFFQAFGLDFGNKPGEAKGGATYHPITELDLAAWKKEADDLEEHAGETITRNCGHLANLLTQQYQGDLFEVVKFSLREIVRNVYEHSDSQKAYFCGQFWPATGVVEISIMDEGIGMRKSLSANPHLKMEDDYDALKWGLLPGISGKVYKGKEVKNKTEWTNSGFGLFMTSQICRKGGQFFISSGEAGIKLTDGKVRISTDTSGTIIMMRISTAKLGATSPLLYILAKKGEEIAKSLGDHATLTASSASKMLLG